MLLRALSIACLFAVTLAAAPAWADDRDFDGIADESDNCLHSPNPGQEDGDADGIGDPCDNCPEDSNPGQEDSDRDYPGDACDPCNPGTDCCGNGEINPGETCDTYDECCPNCIAISGPCFYGGDTCTDEMCDGEGHCVTIGPSGACPSTTYPPSTTTTTLSPTACGNADGSLEITGADALMVLHAAVGTRACDPCVCDVDGAGGILARDGLLTLQFAVELPVVLACPVCG